MSNTLKNLALPNEAFNCFLGRTTDDMLVKAADYLENHEYASIPATVLHEMFTDDDQENGRIILKVYASSSPLERAKMDYMMTSLCGWTLASILERMKTSEYDEEEGEAG